MKDIDPQSRQRGTPIRLASGTMAFLLLTGCAANSRPGIGNRRNFKPTTELTTLLANCGVRRNGWIEDSVPFGTASINSTSGDVIHNQQVVLGLEDSKLNSTQANLVEAVEIREEGPRQVEIIPEEGQTHTYTPADLEHRRVLGLNGSHTLWLQTTTSQPHFSTTSPGIQVQLNCSPMPSQDTLLPLYQFPDNTNQ